MWQLISSSALAQETVEKTIQTNPSNAPAQQPSALASFLPFILIFVIFYFLLIRPQKKRMEEEQSLLASLNKGDEVYTKSGMIGVITGLTEKVVTLEVAEGVKIKVLRSYIGGLAQKLFEKTGSAANSSEAPGQVSLVKNGKKK